jgi:hypothetical protein
MESELLIFWKWLEFVSVPVSAANVFQAVIMPIDVEVDAIVLNGVKIFTKIVLLWTFLKIETN